MSVGVCHKQKECQDGVVLVPMGQAMDRGMLLALLVEGMWC